MSDIWQSSALDAATIRASVQCHTGHPERAVQALQPFLTRLDPDRAPANVTLRFAALGYASAAAACTPPPAQAEAWARYAYTASTRWSGDHDATTLEAAYAWAALLTSRGAHRDADTLYKQILGGKEHLATASAGEVFQARADLALSTHRLGRCGQASYDLGAGWSWWVAAGGGHDLRVEVGLRWTAVLVACDLPADARTVLARITASYPPPGSPDRVALRRHAATLIATTMTGHDQVCARHDDVPDLDPVEDRRPKRWLELMP